MKIFITGGTGFVGTQVVKQLTSKKHEVHILKHRLNELSKIENDLKRFKPDVVIHLAWGGLPDIGPEVSAKNVIEALQFFELVSKLKIPKLMAAGSAWLSGDQEELYLSGHGPFVAAKNAIKVFGEAAMKPHNGTFVWFNPFFVYGAGKKAVSLVPVLIAQAQKGETPTPRNPDAWHDFIYIDDLARAIALLATKKVPAGSYDLGSGTLTRTGDIAKILSQLCGLPAIKTKPIAKKGNKADITAIQKVTGWKPRVSIKEGLSAMLKSKK